MIDWNQILPTGALATVGTAIVGIILSKIKAIPFKIVFGNENKNGKTLITADKLIENCKTYHDPLTEKIERIYDRQTEVLEHMANIQGYMEGRYGREKTGRR